MFAMQAFGDVRLKPGLYYACELLFSPSTAMKSRPAYYTRVRRYARFYSIPKISSQVMAHDFFLFLLEISSEIVSTFKLLLNTNDRFFQMQCNSCSKCHILCFYCLKVNGSNRAGGENNEFEQWSRIRAPQPRNGWSTPTYDDILDQKRKEEKSYRLVICYRMLFILTIQGSSFVYAYRITAHLLNIHLIQNVVQKLF